MSVLFVPLVVPDGLSRGPKNFGPRHPLAPALCPQHMTALQFVSNDDDRRKTSRLVRCSCFPLPLLLRGPLVGHLAGGIGVVSHAARARASYLCSDIEEHGTELTSIRADSVLRNWWWRRELLLLALRPDQATGLATVDRLYRRVLHLVLRRLSKDAHDHRASAMSALMLAEIVRSRELLAAICTLKWLVMSVK